MMPEKLKLGDTDVARIGLGTNRLTNTPDNVAFIGLAVAAGVDMIDTAHLYTKGESEATIGAALPAGCDGCIIATKGGYGGAGRGRPEVLQAEIEESLRRLKTDRIDLYYLHRVDPETPLEESLGAIKEYADRGVIRHVGISDVSIEQIERARRVVTIAAVQNNYSIAERGHDDVVDYCTQENIVFVPYFPLHGGDSSVLNDIAAKHRATTSQIKLAWLLHRSQLMLPIPGTLSIDHLEQNLAALDIRLTLAEYSSL
jgi:pyridoxine 4-dehydrogenase